MRANEPDPVGERTMNDRWPEWDVLWLGRIFQLERIQFMPWVSMKERRFHERDEEEDELEVGVGDPRDREPCRARIFRVRKELQQPGELSHGAQPGPAMLRRGFLLHLRTKKERTYA